MTVRVDPGSGGRLASVTVAGTEFLVGADADDAMLWGAYPMVPFAGRVRDGIVRFGGREHVLRLNAPPHSIHGTVFDAPWDVASCTPTEVTMTCDLGSHWPFGGTARHVVGVDDGTIHCLLTVTADDNPMPAQVGWHPWFVPEAEVRFDFAAMLARDSAGIATARRVPVPGGTVDDCFVEPDGWPRISVGDVTLELRSDCSHWVVYNESSRGTCVEPQSGAPNGVNDDPVVLQPGESLTRRMELVRVQP